MRFTRPGYSRAELDRAQERFGLTFPPDLWDLMLDRRIADGHDWNDEAAIRKMLAWPFEGLLFDVEHNALWGAKWGQRPDNADGRAEVLRCVVGRAPRLIPIYSHRYLPADPCEAGNPVFSIYQSDIIYYGANLADYLAREQDGHDDLPWPEIRHIPFWSEMVERWDQTGQA